MVVCIHVAFWPLSVPQDTPVDFHLQACFHLCLLVFAKGNGFLRPQKVFHDRVPHALALYAAPLLPDDPQLSKVSRRLLGWMCLGATRYFLCFSNF